MKLRTTLIPGFLLFFACGPAMAAEASEVPLGTVTGQVTISQNLAAQRMKFRLYPSYKPVPPPPEGAARDDEFQNIVMFLEPLDGQAIESRPAQAHEIAQLGETFIPHVQPVVVGDSVGFPNLDPIFHNVFSLSSTRTFDLGRYPKGESRAVTFEQAGVVPVFCHLHSDMSAVVLVLETPLFTIPQADGSYSISGVPRGRYTLVAWHERSDRVETTITVGEGETVEVDVTVPILDEDEAD